MKQPLVFISYSHRDETEKNQLVAQLEVLEKAGMLRLWVDDRIDGGGDWNREIRDAITEASVAVLLVSAHYLSSDFIANHEVPEFLSRRQSHGLVAFPVIAKHCVWKQIGWLKELNVRPKNGRPVWGHADSQPDEDLAAIAEEISLLVMKSRAEHPEPAAEVPAAEVPADLHQWMSLPGSGHRAGAVSALVQLLKSGEAAASNDAARALKTLVVDKGEALQGEVIVVPEGETLAGRATENPIVINDSTVSRRHFLVARRGQRLSITDLGSSNGTHVNGERLPPRQARPLRNGDEIRVSEALGYTVCQDVFLVRQPAAAEPPRTEPAAPPARYAAAAPARFCGSCGRAIHTKAVFCRFCGTLAMPKISMDARQFSPPATCAARS